MDQDASQPFDYDRITYPGIACEAINLRNLEVSATIAGLEPAAISQARVLDLGCADGANVLPSALCFPESSFVGIDLAGEQIRQASELAEAAGIRNIDFRHQGVGDVEKSLGSFDYILCHGVFSWVGDEQRQAILRICRDCLAPGGIAAISYNTLPGWNFNASLRAFFRHHALKFDDPHRQIAEARRVIEHLAAFAPARSSHGSFYLMMRDFLRSKNDAYLYHEYLTDHNRPFYFFEFRKLAADHQLRYVVEADFRQASGFQLNPSGQHAITQSPTEDQEQMLDFLVHRHSRQSILCHAGLEPSSSEPADKLAELYIAFVDPLDGVELDPSDPKPIRLNFERGSATLAKPIVKAAIRYLADQWPTAVRFCDLVEASAPFSTGESSEASTVLAQSLLAIYGSGLLKVFKTPPQTVGRPTKMPQVTPLVRSAASRGLTIVNQWHQNITDLGENERNVLSRLDGTRDVEQLALDLKLSPDEGTKMLESFARKLLLVE